MTFLELQDAALDWLDDVNATYFTRPTIKRYVNNAQRELQKLLLNAGEDWYTRGQETDTVIDQARYSYPSDFLKVMALSKVTSGSGDTAETEEITPLVRNEIGLITGVQVSGDSFNYVMEKASFRLVPVPLSVSTIRLDYAYRVADMVDDSDIPDAPQEYHEYISVLAARDGFLKDGRDLAPIESKLGYYERLLMKDSEQRKQDYPRMVVQTDVGYGEY